MTGAAQATQKVQEILDETKRSPRELNSDRVVEWTNARFKELCRREGIYQKFKQARNHIATIDAAIAIVASTTNYGTVNATLRHVQIIEQSELLPLHSMQLQITQLDMSS